MGPDANGNYLASSRDAMTPFEFSARTLDELERVQGRRGTGRGRVDRRGNRNAERALGAMLRAPHELVFGGVARVSDAVASRPSRSSGGRHDVLCQRRTAEWGVGEEG